MRLHLTIAALLLSPALAAPLTVIPVPDARAALPRTELAPQPQKAEFPAGTLPLAGLGVRLVGPAPELAWAARDLKAEWKARLGTDLLDGGKTSITIGTRADANLAARAKALGLDTDKPESYALWVDATGAYVVGADPRGAYHGAQTLRQLLTAGGLRFARIQDAPGLSQRVAMLYLDGGSQGVNDRLIPLLAQMKYNAVLLMCNYVQWDAAKAGGWAHPGGATKAEAARVAALAREHGLEVIPLIETLGHVGWMFYGGKNRDLVQDPGSQNPYAYDTLNPQTYERVIFPVLAEAVELFRPARLHIGHDEVQNRDRFPARENGRALGFERLFADDTVRLHGFLKARGVGTMIWHDEAFGDSVIATLPARLPRDIEVAYWSYIPSDGYPTLSRIKALGFSVLGASWSDPGNPENMARSAAQLGALGGIQTRWPGYFGNPSVWDGTADQSVALVRGGASFWNPAGRAVTNAASIFRDLYAPTPYQKRAGGLVDLTPLVTRSLRDEDGKGWIGKGDDTDLRSLGAGSVQVGGYRFQVGGAVMLRGSRAAVKDLPESATLELNRKADAIAFLHTTGWPGATNRESVGRYEIRYSDGSVVRQPLEYGRHIRAWTDLPSTSLVLAPGWTGQTGAGLDVNVPILEWVNLRPELTIQSVTLVSEGKGANPTLIGLTLLGGGK